MGYDNVARQALNDRIIESSPSQNKPWFRFSVSQMCLNRHLGLKERTAALATSTIRVRGLATGVALAAGLTVVRPIGAQSGPRVDLGGMIEVGREEERYLRALQIAGLTAVVPWSIQPLSPSQARKLRAARSHPWTRRYDSMPLDVSRSPRIAPLRPSARLIGNSAFPVQDGPGPTWAGRGLTGEVQAGINMEWRAVSAQVAPLAFVSQNSPFPLAANGQSGALAFADARFPGQIDAPQRFGDKAYQRLTGGNSSFVLDGYGVLGAFSSAPNRWGPAREFPLVLNERAGGFPEVHLGTSEPFDLWLFRLHVRAMYARLSQSAFAAVDTGETLRLGSGAVVVALPRGLDGLEVGISRFAHRPWEGLPSANVLGRPFGAIISSNRPGSQINDLAENQVASIFARWVLPAGRLEVYAEMFKEDFPGGFHEAASTLVEKPDDYSAYTLGFQRVMRANSDEILALRGEVVNGETSHQERGQRGFATPIPVYIHSPEYQGHTVNGLILGSAEAYDGAAWRLGLDEYTPAGRRSITLERRLRLDWLPTLPASATTGVRPDVIYAVRLEMVRFWGTRDYTISFVPAVNLNRNLIAGNDVFNLGAAFSLRGW